MSTNSEKKSSGQLRKEKHEEKMRFIKKIKDAGLYSSSKDRNLVYKEKVSDENKNDIEFVVRSFKFLRQESGFVPILIKLSEKYEMTYYDTAIFIHAACMGIQDTFDSLSYVSLPEHFEPHKVPLAFLKNKDTVRELQNRWISVNEAVRTEHTENYFYQKKFLDIIGYKVLKYFHEINRLRKLGISKKFSPNSKIIIDLLKKRYS